jgi:hypothetical protein
VRKISIFVVLVACLSLYVLYSLHLGIGRGISIPVVQFVEGLATKIQVLVDRTPPTAPGKLSGGTAPIVQRVAGYYNSTHVPTHSMMPFDSTGGDLIVVFAGTHEDAVLTPSDNYKNAWISLAGPTSFGPTSISNGINLRGQMWCAKNPKVGPNHIFTMTLSKNLALVLSLFVVKGSNISDPIDAVSPIGNDADTRAQMPMSPRITTTHANSLLIGFAKSLSSETWTADAEFAFQPAASSDYLVAESGLAATPGDYQSKFVITGTTNWQAAIVAVRPAASLANTGPITLAWQASSDNVGVAGYQVERCSGINCADFAQIGTSKENSFVDSTTSTPALYRYRVRAFDAASNKSKYSDTITVDMLSTPTAGAR